MVIERVTRINRPVDDPSRGEIFLRHMQRWVVPMTVISGHEAEIEPVLEWHAHLREFVRMVWGIHESTALVAVLGPASPQETAVLVNVRVTNLIQRCGALKVRRDLIVKPKPAWMAFIDSTYLLHPEPKSDPNVT